MRQATKSSLNVPLEREFCVTQSELAALMGRDPSIIRRWEKAGTLRKTEAGYPVLENMRAALDYLCAGAQQKQVSKAELDAERVRNLKLDAEAKEREKKKDEGEWIKAAVWLPKIGEHIGDLRAKVKALLLTDQPATLSGRSEADIREANGKTYTQLCRWMQNAATKLRPPGAREITVPPE